MEKLHISTSRYGTKRYIEKEKDNVYIISGDSHYYRVIGDKFIFPDAFDFEGGPFISIGMSLLDLGYLEDLIITKIENISSDKEDFCKVKLYTNAKN